MLLRPSDGAVLATVPVGRSPFGVTVSISLSGINVWVASFGTDTVSIIDPKQLR
jgi:DNA-binding beta-propeller fold protein YncE